MEQKKTLKKLNSFPMPDKKWVLVPFIESQKAGETPLFTEGTIYETQDPESFFVALQHFDSAKILHFQAFFFLTTKKTAGYEPEYEFKATIANQFRCGWREEKESKLPELKKKLIKHFFKKHG